jgi:hypothetical protein
MRMAIIAITTSNSISVKARQRPTPRGGEDMETSDAYKEDVRARLRIDYKDAPLRVKQKV